MPALRLYKWAAIILLVVNLAMIALFFWTKPPHKTPLKGLNFESHKILELDDSQNEHFLESAQRHIQQIESLNAQQKTMLQEYFDSLVQPKDSVEQRSLLLKLEALEGKKIEMTLAHLKEVKSLLRPDQEDNFKIFYQQLLGRMLLQEKKTGPPPPEF
ncbi:hypothetical protein CLV98_11217 [Dyadobacter jejuensis]|uniref:Heavy-metal resistance protein n=1 Tax=Dyadobacter jejuensis TaxID=1082580 RepID=A0A316ADU7_9BACT|nr:hypothetical protein [Dyadobacter jejuensis]PWJ55923.1 hypothetical protein CLV98_11217 [Dyadobacter jejuensis]